MHRFDSYHCLKKYVRDLTAIFTTKRLTGVATRDDEPKEFMHITGKACSNLVGSPCWRQSFCQSQVMRDNIYKWPEKRHLRNCAKGTVLIEIPFVWCRPQPVFFLSFKWYKLFLINERFQIVRCKIFSMKILNSFDKLSLLQHQFFFSVSWMSY